MIAPDKIILKPINTEKSLIDRSKGKYHFWVAAKSTKGQIFQAFVLLFSIKPLKINTIKLKGKTKTNWKNRKTYTKINRKKAIITLKTGTELDLFSSKKKKTKSVSGRNKK
ncbi:50S ribosomal protein L23 [Patescibacteria group bacterium]|nr:50S ribosomal protein L23 [Patescibacteria group bacterium]MCG2702451.1 50S ribosomal protein L23 [Candidatus Parcubacteria bacterium]MBU4210309.1 50S ribosomal protein L23 [Patescibacteria group bacterium]MBU4264499.1 50S ribosomal protein L23 [Patescibacteria group bacterium]MBU4390430.1 50S ribosomal protein L23 [Patescibacteria group bacterium]